MKRSSHRLLYILAIALVALPPHGGRYDVEPLRYGWADFRRWDLMWDFWLNVPALVAEIGIVCLFLIAICAIQYHSKSDRPRGRWLNPLLSGLLAAIAFLTVMPFQKVDGWRQPVTGPKSILVYRPFFDPPLHKLCPDCGSFDAVYPLLGSELISTAALTCLAIVIATKWPNKQRQSACSAG